MGMKTVTETRFRNTLIIVTGECSPTATETIEKKLERLILRHISDKKCSPFCINKPLAMCENKSEYGTYH